MNILYGSDPSSITDEALENFGIIMNQGNIFQILLQFPNRIKFSLHNIEFEKP